MDIYDVFLTPAYLFIIYLALVIIRNQTVKKPELRKHFIPAITLKFVGALALGIIYQFYYKGGDTLNYYCYGATDLYKVFVSSPINGFRLIFHDTDGPPPNDLAEFTSRIFWINDSACYFIIRIASLIGFFTFNTYSVIALFFALFSFSGQWAMYRVLCRKYPGMEKQLAIGLFYLPSVFFWGSGILKDPITFGCLCWLVAGLFNLFIFREKILASIFITLLSIIVIKIVKIYILLCFIPCACLWLFLEYNKSIKTTFLRILSKPLLLIFGVVMGFFAAGKVTEENEKYSYENIVKTSQVTSADIYRVSMSSNGSGYNLGEFEMTPTGLLKVAPLAIWTTLFRPFIWESHNVVMLISAFECLYLLLLTIHNIYKTGPGNFYRSLTGNPFALASIAFSILFAFSIGISTFNFGTLVRYKIPILPFYIFAIQAPLLNLKPKHAKRIQLKTV